MNCCSGYKCDCGGAYAIDGCTLGIDPDKCERCDYCGVYHEGNHNCKGD